MNTVSTSTMTILFIWELVAIGIIVYGEYIKNINSKDDEENDNNQEYGNNLIFYGSAAFLFPIVIYLIFVMTLVLQYYFISDPRDDFD